MDTFELPVGVDKSWQVQIQSNDPTSGEQVPYNGFISGDTLVGEVWAGQSQTILFNPSVSWVGAPSSGLIEVSFASSQTLTVAPGRYRLRVQVATTDGRVVDVLDIVLKVVSSAGSTAALKTYCGYSDLLLYAPWIDDLEDVDSDLSGFAAQRAQARQHLNRVILSRVPASQCYGNFGLGYGLNSSNEGTNPYFLQLLENGQLVITPQVVEITARYTIGLISESMISPTDDVSGYQRVASTMFSKANNLLNGYIAEFDLIGSGIGPFLTVPCNVMSTRLPTPNCTSF